jgi:glycosyltransferase involved in cell wall biosynthesis
MSRAFLVCPEPVRAVTAGVGTRFRTLAAVLADAGHHVTLAVPNDADEVGNVPPGVVAIRALPEQLGAQAEEHDWVLLHGHLGNHYLSQRDDLPVVVDLYDPFLVENLHYHRTLGFAPYRTDHATWRLQLGRGDFFLCSSAEQRFFYLGWLGALGRVNPLAIEGDPGLDSLIAELPFGTPDSDPPASLPPAQVIPGIASGAPVIYFGGVYDWYDPGVLLDALPTILQAHPGVVVVFVDHPHPDETPLGVAASAKRTAFERGWLGSTVRFEGWRPFERRFELALAADLAVVTHRPGLETDLSLRTRLVDLLWLGLPVISTEGGTMGRVLEATGAGVTVPAGDPDALAAAIIQFLADPGARHVAGSAGRAWAREHTWATVARPLLDFAASPRRDIHRSRFVELAPAASRADEPIVRRLRRALGRLGGRS